ncbi:MAG: hypothetical protein JNK57_04170 [Planctomycetaceae bacterium]|nr:hypothetical protein [Planctomycetaceae bacterium]
MATVTLPDVLAEKHAYARVMLACGFLEGTIKAIDGVDAIPSIGERIQAQEHVLGLELLKKVNFAIGVRNKVHRNEMPSEEELTSAFKYMLEAIERHVPFLNETDKKRLLGSHYRSPAPPGSVSEPKKRKRKKRWDGLSERTLLAIRVLAGGVDGYETASASVNEVGEIVTWHTSTEIADMFGIRDRIVVEYLDVVWNGSFRQKNPVDRRRNSIETITAVRKKSAASLYRRGQSLMEAIFVALDHEGRISRPFVEYWAKRPEELELEAIKTEERRFRAEKLAKKGPSASNAVPPQQSSIPEQNGNATSPEPKKPWWRLW